MKLFVTVGNALQPFDRFLSAVDTALRLSGRDWEGVCQYGSSRVRPHGLECVREVSRADFEGLMREADVVACHAGVGTLMTAIRAGHRPLVMPRLREYGEHVNDHQTEIATSLAKEGKLVLIPDAKALPDILDGLPASGTRRTFPEEAGGGLPTYLGDELRRGAHEARFVEWVGGLIRVVGSVLPTTRARPLR